MATRCTAPMAPAALGFDQGWAVDDPCFFKDEARGWIIGRVTKVVGVGRTATLSIAAAVPLSPVDRGASEVEAASERAREGVEDMVTLDELTEATVLSTLRVRYDRKKIYTNVGGILVAVNPYEQIANVYGEDCMAATAAADAAFKGAAPHPFVMCEQALRALDRDRASQSFVISGESGSGKTETCKFILRYLSYRSKRRFELSNNSRGGANALEESVLLSNPILEAFGNAKTLRNDNSSRWGKYTQVYVQPSSGAIKSVGITAYLLEKVRVVERQPGERNYHVLHQLVAGARRRSTGDAGLALALGLGAAQTSHAVLRDTATSSASIGVDDEAQFRVTRDALEKLNVAQPGLFGALAAVCHLGDMCFEEVETEGQDAVAAIAPGDLRQRGRAKAEHAADAAARALGVDRAQLEEALIARRVAGVRTPRKAAEAEHASKAFGKALYARVFDWVLARVNDALRAMTHAPTRARDALTGAKTQDLLTVGLLDIFGFERFDANSLEQLLINYANERLLREFNAQVFESATREYAAEGVPVGDLTFQDNTPLLKTLEHPRDGVFAMLNSECVRRDGSDANLLKQLLKKHQREPFIGDRRGLLAGVFVPRVHKKSTDAERADALSVFGVSHFATDVAYRVQSFVEKNRDRLPNEICALAATSDAPFIASLFADVDEEVVTSQQKRSQRYVASSFAESLGKLTQLLDATRQSFVRCVKPNDVAKAAAFDGVVVLEQLRCMGMLELIEARARGYAGRMDHGAFASRYGLLLEDKVKDVKKYATKATKKLLVEFLALLQRHFLVDGVAVGKTKVFLKRQAVNALETARETRMKADVLLALGEAVTARDIEALELTLLIADELRLAETPEAERARREVAVERSYRALVSAICAGRADVIAAALEGENSGAGRVGEAVDCARAAWAGLAIADALDKATTDTAAALVKQSVSAQSALTKELNRAREVRNKDVAESSPELPLETLRAIHTAVDERVAACARLAEQKSAIDALANAVDQGDRNVLAKVLAQYEALPGAAVRIAVNGARDALAVTKLRAELLRHKEACTMLEKESWNDKTCAAYAGKAEGPLLELEKVLAQCAGKNYAWLRKDVGGASAVATRLKTKVYKADARAQALAMEKLASAERARVLAAQAEAKAEAAATAQREVAARAEQIRVEEETTRRRAAETRAAAAAAADAPPPPPALEGLSESELARVRESELSRSRAVRMEGLDSKEESAIKKEGDKVRRAGQAAFCDLPWAARVKKLVEGTRLLKLSTTSAARVVPNAEWKHVRLNCACDSRGTPLLANDPGARNPDAKRGAYLTWPSHTLLRRGHRKLMLDGITAVHVGTNAKQWCTMVPTEWHYVTLVTKGRSYDFGFEDASELLLWVNTLQRIICNEWTQQCNAGEAAELFRGAISDAQHRFYRSRKAGAGSSEHFDPSLKELCPVLYPLAPQLASTAAGLGVSFSHNAPRPHKFCAWTAAAVLEAPIAHAEAVVSMRAVLSDLGFYADGRFACSAGFYDENGLAHTLARQAIKQPSPASADSQTASESSSSGMLVIRAQHAKTGKVSVLKIKKGTKMASVFEAHAKHKGLKSTNLEKVKSSKRSSSRR